MNSPVNRNNLSELVAQYLAQGGEVEELAPPAPSTRKRKERKKVARQRSGSDFRQPISLFERSLMPEVRRCAEDGLQFTQILSELGEEGLTRGGLCRIIQEYELEIAKPEPQRRRRLKDNEVVEAVVACLPSGRGLSTIGKMLGVRPERARKLFNRYHESNPFCPEPGNASGRKSAYTDEELLPIILAGLEAGVSPRGTCIKIGVAARRGIRLHKEWQDRHNSLGEKTQDE